MVLKLEHFVKYSRHTVKVSKCGAGDGWTSVGTIVCKMKYLALALHRVKEDMNILHTIKRRHIN